MLDLMTLSASMGLQTEMKKVREETGAAVHNDETTASEQETTCEETTSPLGQAAEVVADALSAVEATVVSAASAMIPSGEAVSEVLQSVPLEAPVLDLSLPTQATSSSGKK